MSAVTTYVINRQDVFKSDLIFSDPELYKCRKEELNSNHILKDDFTDETIPLKSIAFKTPTKDKQLYDILNAHHNRYVLHNFLEHNSNKLFWAENYCKQKQIQLKGVNKLDFTNNYNIYLVGPTAKHACLKLLMIHHLKHHVHAKLGTSKYGVGVFAIRDIPAGMPIFDNLLSKCASYRPVTVSKCNADKIQPNSIESLLGDFFLQNEKKITYPVPLLGPNSIDPSFYLNHSDTPNLTIKQLEECDMTVYVAAEPIKVGDQLTINYRQFNIPVKQMEERMPFLVGDKRCI